MDRQEEKDLEFARRAMREALSVYKGDGGPYSWVRRCQRAKEILEKALQSIPSPSPEKEAGKP